MEKQKNDSVVDERKNRSEQLSIKNQGRDRAIDCYSDCCRSVGSNPTRGAFQILKSINYQYFAGLFYFKGKTMVKYFTVLLHPFLLKVSELLFYSFRLIDIIICYSLESEKNCYPEYEE